MARKPKPWYWKKRKQWCVIIDGVRHMLGPEQDEADRKYHELMLNPGEDDSITIFEVMDDFLDWTFKHRSEETYSFYKKRLKRYKEENKNMECSKFRVLHVQRWLDKQDWGSTYKAGIVTSFKRCFNWAVRQGYLKSNPIQYLEKPKAKRRDTPVTREEYDIILGEVDKKDPFYDLVVFSWETGARPQESLRFTADDVNLKTKRIVIENPKARGPKWRVIHLNRTAMTIVRRWIKRNPEGPVFTNTTGKPWTPNACSNRFDRMKDKTGRSIALYDFRHAFGTDLLKSGVDPITVAEMMGHSDLKMLMEIYQHVGQDGKYIDEQFKKRRSVNTKKTKKKRA